ncbi:MAG: hypothetical protein ABI551_13495 [Polyangiaceae bacterium]
MTQPLPRQYISSGGRLTVDVVSPRMLQTRMVGHLDLQLARQFLAILEGWVNLGGSNLVAFHDWEELVDYESEARILLTPWSKANRTKFEGIHMLIRGRAIAWGLNIFNALTGDVMTVHHVRDSFAQARQAAGERAG